MWCLSLIALRRGLTFIAHKRPNQIYRTSPQALIYFPDGHTFIFLLMHTKSYDQLLSLQSRTHPFLMHTKSYFPYGHAPIFLLMHTKSYDQLLSLQSHTHPFLMHTKSYFPYGHAPIFLLMHIKSLNCEGAVRISLLSGQCSYRLS